MSERLACADVAALLERFERGEVSEEGTEQLAAHLESCPACGPLDAATESSLRESVAGLAEPLPDDSFFAARLAETMAAIAEPASAEGRAPGVAEDRRRGAASIGAPRSAARVRPRRLALVGAIAAGAVLALGVLLAGRDEPIEEPRSAAAPPVEAARRAKRAVVSVEEADASRLAASDDAWIVARTDSLALGPVSVAGSPERAAAGESPERAAAVEDERRTRMVVVLRIAEELELDEAGTIHLAAEYRKFDARRRELLGEKSVTEVELEAALAREPRNPDELARLTADLLRLDRELALLPEGLFESLQSRLDTEQKARLALLKAKLQKKIERVQRGRRGEAPPPPRRS